jgi:hypothetical protein
MKRKSTIVANYATRASLAVKAGRLLRIDIPGAALKAYVRTSGAMNQSE